MTKNVLNIILSFFIGSFLGAVSLLCQTSNDFFFSIFPLWLFYGMFYQSVVVFIYLVLNFAFSFFKYHLINPFFAIGVVDFVVRSQDFFSKHHNLIPHSKGDWLLFMPSLSLILIGLIYWIWVKYYKETVKNISKK